MDGGTPISNPRDSIAAPLWFLSTVAAVACLYFAKQVLVPLTLAMLFALLLSPVVAIVEKWKVGRVLAVCLVLIFSFATIGAIGWTVTEQLVDVTSQLPNYKDNIHQKLQSLRHQSNGSLSQLTNTMNSISGALSPNPPKVVPQPAPKSGAANPLQSPGPISVQVVRPSPTVVWDLLGPVFGRLAIGLIVVVFTFFMLVKKEDLRHRILKLAGRGQSHAMSQAIDDAGQRVSHYLLTQFIINVIYGLLFGTGLYFIGLPNALLWGVLAGLFRFVPYLGVWVAAAFPVLIALAIFHGWTQALVALGLFLAIEFAVANFVEPWIYAAGTGVSSLAILVAAVFWTAMWGPIGLFLSTPLTVCLVVLGQYFPPFEFLYFLFGDEAATQRRKNHHPSESPS